jgi:hypothetical protein
MRIHRDSWVAFVEHVRPLVATEGRPAIWPALRPNLLFLQDDDLGWSEVG